MTPLKNAISHHPNEHVGGITDIICTFTTTCNKPMWIKFQFDSKARYLVLVVQGLADYTVWRGATHHITPHFNIFVVCSYCNNLGLFAESGYTFKCQIDQKQICIYYNIHPWKSKQLCKHLDLKILPNSNDDILSWYLLKDFYPK